MPCRTVLRRGGVRLGAGAPSLKMNEQGRGLQAAVWAAAEGVATAGQVAVLDADPGAARRALEELLADTEEQLAVVERLTGPERDQVVADVQGDLARLTALEVRWAGTDQSEATGGADVSAGVRLQASW